MEKHLNVLSQALNKANIAGAFNLQESAIVAASLGAVIQALGVKPSNPIEEARAEAKAKNSKGDSDEKTATLDVVTKDKPTNKKE